VFQGSPAQPASSVAVDFIRIIVISIPPTQRAQRTTPDHTLSHRPSAAETRPGLGTRADDHPLSHSLDERRRRRQTSPSTIREAGHDTTHDTHHLEPNLAAALAAVGLVN
jgi:hypothetical protein